MKIPLLNLEIRRPSSDKQVDKAISALPAKAKEAVRGLILGYTSGNPEKDKTGYKITVDSLFTLYRTSGDIHGCIRELKQAIGINGYRWIDPISGEITENATTQNADEVMTRLSSFEFLKDRIVTSLKVSGNAYIELVKNMDGSAVVGMRCLDPRTMRMVIDKHGNVFRYFQQYGPNVVEFQEDEIIHIITEPDPMHEAFGMSPMEPIIWEARSDIGAMLSNYYFFENNAQPSTVYVLDDNMGEEAAKDAMTFIKEQFSGTNNRHKPAIMNGIKDIKQVSLTHQEMEFLSGRKFATEKICAAFGVPKMMLGYTESLNYSNSEQQYKKFIQNTAKPEERKLADAINRLILPILGVQGATFEFIPTETIDELTMIQETRENAKSGLLSINEARTRLGYEALPDTDFGDKHLVMGGANATFLEDVGVDPIVDPNSEENQQKFLKILESAKSMTDEQQRN